MKRILTICIGFLLLCSFSMDVTYNGNYGSTPVLMKRSVFESAIKRTEPQDLKNTSRICILDEVIFVVELYQGIHVIDNSDPSNPTTVHFLNIPGCVDMSIKGTQLFARSAEDLVAIDISQLANNSIKEINRVRETFPELTNSGDEDDSIPSRFSKEERPENTVIVAWIDTDND